MFRYLSLNKQPILNITNGKWAAYHWTSCYDDFSSFFIPYTDPTLWEISIKLFHMFPCVILITSD